MALAALFLLPGAVRGGAAEVTSRGDSGLRLTVTPGRYSLVDIERDGRSWRRVECFGSGRIGEAGRPDLPVEGFWIAVPPGFEMRARVVDAEFEDIEGAPIVPAPRDTMLSSGPALVAAYDARTYATTAWWPGPMVTVGETARLRHQDLVPLRVRFFQTNPATGTLRVYRRIDVEVTFVPDPEKRAAAPAEPVGDEGSFERIYQGTIVNYDQARAFRSRPARPMRAMTKQGRLLGEYKIRVEKSGLYRIDFEKIQSAGLAPGTPFSSIALFRRSFDDDSLAAGGDPFAEVSMPFAVSDVLGDSLFGAGDALVAYLPGFREDRMKKDYQDRYDDRAVYYLSVESARAELPVRSGFLGYPGLAPLPSFPDSIRWEVDTYYDIKSPADTLDLYFAMGEISPPSKTTEIDLPAVDTSAPYAIKAMTVSVIESEKYHSYVLTNQAGGDTVLNVVAFGERGALFKTDRTRDGADLAAGVNRFFYYGSRGDTQGAINIDGAGGFLDWYEVHADFLYRARSDYLAFSSGDGAGRVRMDLAGFTSPGVYLFDVADPYRPVRALADSVRAEGGAYTVVLQDSVAASKRYVAATLAGAKTLPNGSVTADAPTDIASGEAEYVIIAHDDFVEACGSFADYRSSRGTPAKVVAVSDVYDQFNGGPKDVVAIRRFLEYAFLRWSTPPKAALLVGDGYEDYKGIASNAEPGEKDHVPAWPDYVRYPDGSGDHWDVGDLRYVLFDGASDPLPEILIGRFPATTADEVRVMAEKTIAYENFGDDDDWRRRAVFVADDAWTYESGPIQYVGQTDFEVNSAMFSRELKETAARGIDTVNVFLSRFTDVYHPLCPYAPDPANPKKADVDCTIDLCRDGVTPAIFDVMNGEGAGLINFQGHGNRNVLTHEVILRSGGDYRQGFSLDIRERSHNEGRPYVFMAYGCSICEFERFRSFGWKSIPEEMLILESGGAVAAFGSTGIEYLRPNLVLNESVLKYFYQTPGVVPGAAPGSLPPWYAGVPRWTLGEMLYLGMMNFVVNENERVDVIQRYVLFGDPALTLDARPPAFEVTVGGEPVEDGDVLLGSPDGSPVRIEARVHDEVLVDSSSIEIVEAGAPIARDLYAVARDESLGTDGRAWIVTYEPAIRFGEYDVVFRATDRTGRAGTFTLRVRVNISVTFDGRAILDGDYVGVEPSIRAEITTPVPVTENELSFAIDGGEIPLDTLRQVDQFRWIAAARPRLAAGERSLDVSVQGLAKSYRFRVEDRFRVVDLLNYPNPSEGGTGFFYHLTDTADRVRAEIYTLTGKRIRVIDGLAGRVGYNAEADAWDGRDQDGDAVANGVYLYRLVAARGGEKAEAIGKAVIVRH